MSESVNQIQRTSVVYFSSFDDVKRKRHPRQCFGAPRRFSSNTLHPDSLKAKLRTPKRVSSHYRVLASSTTTKSPVNKPALVSLISLVDFH
ncbi:hypothetical protein JOB18_009602 [Solea senegalensis]|uniref:Uncharacterized protein n=1 Tax=Solea senegalensis TaxID=28829 RepID=A0AAV6PPQ6_SOLSE|nr:hypothetical protein JOB18_009602 [Solea senegalensis]